MEQIKTTYGLEEHLDTVCQQAPQFKDLVSSWVLNKRSCATALKQVAQNYPHYSVHDELHAKNVISNMEQILGEDRIRKLSPTDTWMLLQLAYLHDFGMLLLYEKVEAEWAGEDFQEYLQECKESNNPSVKRAADYLSDLKEHLQDDDFEKNWPVQVRRYVTYLISSYYRGKHADLSNQYILSMIQNWGIDLSHNGLIQPRLIKLLGQLSMLHTRDKEAVLAQDYMSNGYSADYIHPRFLAEMLRLGDLLDVDNSRFEPAAEKVTGSLPDDSARHRKKHEATVHLLITPERIEYRADCPDHPAYREARVFLDWLEDELTFSAIHWLDLIPKGFGGSAPRLTKKDLLLNGKPDIENTSGLRFMMSQEKAFDIIEGSGIYSDKMVFLRELIQNAEDASKIQLWRDLQKRPSLYLQPHANADDLSHIQPYDLKPEAFDSYKITVDMKKEPDDRFRIRVIDRGTGMNADTVKQMCNVGVSYHQDKARRREIELMPAWLRPTAGFGIGLQSVFLVTPAFTMYSRTEKGGIKVTVESRKREGYVQVEENSWEKQGTCVEILLDTSFPFSIKVGSHAHHFLDNKYDQFNKDDHVIYYALQDVLWQYCHNTLFPIHLTKEEKKWDYLEKISFSALKDCRENRVEDVIIMKSEQGGVDLWDCRDFVFCHLSCGPHTGATIKFKGKVLNRPSFYYGHPFTVECIFDFYGLDTREYLEISRDTIKREKAASLTSKIERLMQCLVGFLIKQDHLDFLCAKNSLKDFTPDLYYVLWQLADNEQKKMMIKSPELYIEKMVTETEILEWKDDRYISTQTNVKNIINNYQSLYFCNAENYFSADSFQQIDENQEKMKSQFIQNCNQAARDISFSNIVISDEIKNSFPYQQIIAFRFYETLEGLCLYQLGEKSDSPCKMDVETRKGVIKSIANTPSMYYRRRLFISSSRRHGIPIIEDYRDVALPFKETPVRYHWEGLTQISYIISPVLSDETRMSYPCDEFILQIIQSSEFSNLVDYVLKNRADPTPCTREDIVEVYKKLLAEFYNVIHEDDTLEADTNGE